MCVRETAEKGCAVSVMGEEKVVSVFRWKARRVYCEGVQRCAEETWNAVTADMVWRVVGMKTPEA